MTNEGKKIKVSVIIPVYNEEKPIAGVIDGLKEELGKIGGLEWEIIVVNDGSGDQSGEIIKNISKINLINHPYRKGYGACLKKGAWQARYEWLLFFDGDGQHKPECLRDFFEYTKDYDIVIGARQGYQGPLWRQPGKRFLNLIASYLAERKIPDLNCGLRLVKKDYFLKYCHIFPDGFSLSSTSTLAFLKKGLSVKFLPIKIDKRIGESTLKASDGFRVIILLVKLIMLFSPLKIFLPIALIGMSASVIWMGYNLATTNFSLISKSGGFLFVASLLVLLFGLLADQVAAVRREMKE